MKANSRVYGLDLFRAVAITLVILSHFSRQLEIIGVLGVELFFVLSGFLIGGIFLKDIKAVPVFQWTHLYAFLRRRWIRTLPNYYLFLVLNIIYAAVIRADYTIPSWKYFVFLQNFAWQRPGFYSISWSLAIEEWFYLLFPGSVFLCLYLSKSKRVAFITALVIWLTLPFIARTAVGPFVSWNTGIRTVVIYRLDALMFGVALALLKSERVALWPKLRNLFLPGLILASMLLLILEKIAPGQPPLIPVALIFTLLPLSCAFMLPWVENVSRPHPTVQHWVENISKWSYSIYLSHTLILFALYHFADPFAPGFIGKMAVKVAGLACTLVVSACLFNYFEKPIMNLRK